MKKYLSDYRRFRYKGQMAMDGGRSALDRVLEALSREDDRYILYYLMENDPTEFDELVDVVVAVNTGESATAVTDDVREKFETKLHHVRLPKLDDLGIIDYDHRNGTVRYRNPPPHLEDFLHLAHELDEE